MARASFRLCKSLDPCGLRALSPYKVKSMFMYVYIYIYIRFRPFGLQISRKGPPPQENVSFRYVCKGFWGGFWRVGVGYITPRYPTYIDVRAYVRMSTYVPKYTAPRRQRKTERERERELRNDPR